MSLPYKHRSTPTNPDNVLDQLTQINERGARQEAETDAREAAEEKVRRAKNVVIRNQALEDGNYDLAREALKANESGGGIVVGVIFGLLIIWFGIAFEITFSVFFGIALILFMTWVSFDEDNGRIALENEILEHKENTKKIEKDLSNKKVEFLADAKKQEYSGRRHMVEYANEVVDAAINGLDYPKYGKWYNDNYSYEIIKEMGKEIKELKSQLKKS